jgi:hypothetical protein
MKKYLKTTLMVSVHGENEDPIFGESATHVCIEDEAGGPFIILKQTNDFSKSGEVRLELEELKVITEVADELMKQATLKA